MRGSSMSATTASCGAWKIRAFIVLLGLRQSEWRCWRRSCGNQHLHVFGGVRAQSFEARFRLVHAQMGGDHAFDRKSSGGDLCGHAWPVVDAVAPTANDLQVVQ